MTLESNFILLEANPQRAPSRRRHRRAFSATPNVTISMAISAALAGPAWAGGEQMLERVVVTGTSTGLVGVADSANTGTVTQQQLEARTVYRPGELLEATPL